MASQSQPATSSVLFLLLLAAIAAGASTATFTITNNCSYTVWPAGDVGGGTQLDPGQTWTVDVPMGSSGMFWGRTGCSFYQGIGYCNTGDCAGQLDCTDSRPQPPVTLAEYDIGFPGGSNRFSQDNYEFSDDVLVAVGDLITVNVDNYNLDMAFSCSNGVALVCRYPRCTDATTRPHACRANSNYEVTFCPQ